MGSLLEKCFNNAKSKVEDQTKGAHFCLISDGWSNIKNNTVVNYMAISPEFLVFLELVSTGQQVHTYQCITNNIACVFLNHDSTIISGVVTNNTRSKNLA